MFTSGQSHAKTNGGAQWTVNSEQVLVGLVSEDLRERVGGWAVLKLLERGTEDVEAGWDDVSQCRRTEEPPAAVSPDGPVG